jgi:hypothetical protein
VTGQSKSFVEQKFGFHEGAMIAKKDFSVAQFVGK